MFYVRSNSCVEEFEYCADIPVPNIPPGGARVRVHYAGACYTEAQLKGSNGRLKTPGIRDTSVFTGFEVSGIVEEVCPSVDGKCSVQSGDRVVLYPERDHFHQEFGYAEYVVVSDVCNLVKLPASVSLQVAAMLPSGGLAAYNAVLKAKPFVDSIKHIRDYCNVLVVGAGGLGLWTINLAKHIISGTCNTIRITVADTSVENLFVAKKHGCFDIIHWSESDHEEYLIERTKDVCCGKVDVIIDFVSSPRTINRSLKVLNNDGVLIVGGNSRYEIPICLNQLAEKQQSIVGVRRGTMNQLKELVDLIGTGKVSPPHYSTFPVGEANKVFEGLNECRIQGRAVLRVTATDE